jgi:hypothetical protein
MVLDVPVRAAERLPEAGEIRFPSGIRVFGRGAALPGHARAREADPAGQGRALARPPIDHYRNGGSEASIPVAHQSGLL